jgi:hypothetical protein
MLSTEKQVKLACDLYAYCELLKLIIVFFPPNSLSDELFYKNAALGEALVEALNKGDAQEALATFSEKFPWEELKNISGLTSNWKEILIDLKTHIEQRAQRAQQKQKTQQAEQPTRSVRRSG